MKLNPTRDSIIAQKLLNCIKNSLHVVLMMALLPVQITHARGPLPPSSNLVSSQEVANLESVLKKNSIVTNPPQAAELEKLFRARSAAHRLRLSQVYLQVIQDPNFIKEFPEFKPLVADAKKTVKALLEHDASKGSVATQSAIRVLSLTQGINYRDPPKNLSPSDQKVVTETMKNAIDDLNFYDDKAMNNALNSVSHDPTWTKLHKSLSETIDYYDTYKSRQSELAKEGKPLATPSKWLEKLEADGFYSEEQKKGNFLKKKFARYLETTDPLKDPSKFAKADDFLKSTGPQFTDDLEKSFAKKGSELINHAEKIEATLLAKKITKGAVKEAGRAIKGPAALATSYVFDYVISPETANGSDALANAVMASETSKCDTVNCQKFVQECAKKIGVPSEKPFSQASFQNVLEKENFPLCLDEFFNLPLEVQMKQRQDENLDNILSAYTPYIRNLTCSSDNKTTDIEVLGQDKKVSSHRMVFDASGAPTHILRANLPSGAQQRLLFSNSKAQLFQYCSLKKGCENFEPEKVLKTKLWAWRSLPIESFKWAKKGLQLAQHQKQAIQKCCGQQSCQQFFTSRKNNFSNPQQRQAQLGQK